MPKCSFEKAWIGPCDRDVRSPGEKFCHEHRNLKCVSCGKPATKTCEYTGSAPFSCGAYLCDDCEHDAPKNDAVFGLDAGHAPAEVAQKNWKKWHEDLDAKLKEASDDRKG